ncbi:MAG TPA: nuclease-related domain-containing protein [Chthoniobacterales bacterium]|nr:nuclease-related domain-containing protein [Chthoniobacterales bacterium]
MAFERKKNTSRAPVEGPMRRLPGQSIREERERLFDDRVMGYFFAILVAWLFAFWQWLYKWVGSKPVPEVATTVAVLISIYCAYRLWRFRSDFRNLNLAEKGERRVSELLRVLRDKDYITFDDLVLNNCNIDHVVVGPGGVFAIETKARSIFGNGRVSFGDQGRLQIGGRDTLGDPLKQARTSAALVSGELDRYLRRQIWVIPVLIFPGWQIEPPKFGNDVFVLNERAISEFFKSRPAKLNSSEIREICSHLDRSARS